MISVITNSAMPGVRPDEIPRPAGDGEEPSTAGRSQAGLPRTSAIANAAIW